MLVHVRAVRTELPVQPGAVHVAWSIFLYFYRAGRSSLPVRQAWVLHATDYTHDSDCERPAWPWKPTGP